MLNGKNKRRLAFCGAVFCIVLVLLLPGILGQCRPIAGLEVRVFDVGQGDAVLLRTAEVVLLIDAGPGAAEGELCAALSAMGIKAIDAVIFTHPDEDHIGGGDLVLERFSVGEVWLAPIRSDEPCFVRLLEAVSQSGAAVRVGAAGERFAVGELAVRLLAPLAAADDTNNSSIAARIEYGETALLFMGDAGAEVEAALLASGADLRADLLKISHHGSDSATTDALLDAVKPSHAAISCGYGNIHGHPARRVTDALRRRGIAIGRTDLEGTLVYRSDGKSLWRAE
ncbi:MAG: MBL fold metallo-hydrolase [Clostridia bacterium]|nr:MBL fold metallo-hydrolase [Clostridia bacterium]